MTVDMVGPSGVFGRLDIPAAKVGRSGGDIIIVDQLIKILDMAAFKAFVTAIMQDEDLILRLENGKATVKALGSTANIVYRKEIKLKGMKGLKVTLAGTEAVDDGFKSTMLMVNPSPFEIDLGTVHYKVLDMAGQTVGEQKGLTYITRGESTASVTGPITRRVSNGQVRFIGVDVEEDNWYKEVIAAVDITVAITNNSKGWCTA